SVAVPSPLFVKVTPVGSGLPFEINGTGGPTVEIVNVEAATLPNRPTGAPVDPGLSLTAGGRRRVGGGAPSVGAGAGWASVGARGRPAGGRRGVAVLVRLGVNGMPLGGARVGESEGTGTPAGVTVKGGGPPAVNVAAAALVNDAGCCTSSVKACVTMPATPLL